VNTMKSKPTKKTANNPTGLWYTGWITPLNRNSSHNGAMTAYAIIAWMPIAHPDRSGDGVCGKLEHRIPKDLLQHSSADGGKRE
jgi:hypothetical protein